MTARARMDHSSRPSPITLADARPVNFRAGGAMKTLERVAPRWEDRETVSSWEGQVRPRGGCDRTYDDTLRQLTQLYHYVIAGACSASILQRQSARG